MVTIKNKLISPRKVAKSFNKQVGFAAIGAANDSAFATRGAIKDDIKDTFQVRRQWSTGGIRVERATRSRPEVTVGTTRAMYEDHVLGGQRTSTAIPTRAARPNPKRVVTRRNWPGALRDERHFFVENDARLPAPFRRHAGKGERLLIRRGRGRRRKLQLRWALQPSQPVARRWDFERLVHEVLPREFHRAYPARLAHALATARP